MKFTLNINIDNAAFEIMPERELTFLLRKVVGEIEQGQEEGKIMDFNGNTVGKFEITKD